MISLLLTLKLGAQQWVARPVSTIETVKWHLKLHITSFLPCKFLKFHSRILKFSHLKSCHERKMKGLTLIY